MLIPKFQNKDQIRRKYGGRGGGEGFGGAAALQIFAKFYLVKYRKL